MTDLQLKIIPRVEKTWYPGYLDPRTRITFLGFQKQKAPYLRDAENVLGKLQVLDKLKT
jgi:hypothetical protein